MIKFTHGRWFSPASSTPKYGRHDIAEILLKVGVKHKNQFNQNLPSVKTLPLLIHITMDTTKRNSKSCNDGAGVLSEMLEKSLCCVFFCLCSFCVLGLMLTVPLGCLGPNVDHAFGLSWA